MFQNFAVDVADLIDEIIQNKIHLLDNFLTIVEQMFSGRLMVDTVRCHYRQLILNSLSQRPNAFYFSFQGRVTHYLLQNNFTKKKHILRKFVAQEKTL